MMFLLVHKKIFGGQVKTSWAIYIWEDSHCIQSCKSQGQTTFVCANLQAGWQKNNMDKFPFHVKL